ncbi:MAG: DUF4405 domain-containing protein [bacterium]|nr:DUF4405 domain-containing protein [bacterium]
MKNGQKFHTRGFTAFITFLSFIVMTVSGLILFLVPKGSVASWTDWRIFGITKTGWEGVHDIFMIVFLISICMHIFFNWRPLLNYIKGRNSTTVRLKKELIIAVCLITLIAVGSVQQVQPFWSVMKLNDLIKDYWKNTSTSPPVSDAEKLTLSELSVLTQIPLSVYNSIIKEKRLILPEGKPTFEEIAQANEKSPEELYKIISAAIDSINIVVEDGKETDKDQR